MKTNLFHFFRLSAILTIFHIFIILPIFFWFVCAEVGPNVFAETLPETTAPSLPPNLLIIHTDEHNFRTLGCFRETLPPEAQNVWNCESMADTPNVDSLAKQGLLFRHFYTNCPCCTPSRASFVSGRYPQNTGADQNDKLMLEEIRTFASVLQERGYVTGYIGKWHLSGPARPGWGPKSYGFAENTYMFNRGHWKNLKETESGPCVGAVNLKNQPAYDLNHADETTYTTDFLCDRAVDFLTAHRDEPFCLMVSIPDPHGPNQVRAPYDTLYKNLTFSLPSSANGQGRLESMSAYFGMVKCIDDNVGKILDVLKRENLERRTLVVFTSDHGDMCGEHGLNNKNVPFEASAKVPFIIRWPERLPAGQTRDFAMATNDFKPTILALMDCPRDVTDEGRDLSQAVLTGRLPDGVEDVVFSRNSSAQWFMAVWGSMKLTMYRDGSVSLYDVSRDPLELTNLADDPDSKPTVRRMRRMLREYAAKYHDVPLK